MSIVMSKLEYETKKADAAKLDGLLGAAIECHTPLTYLNNEFPATYGHLPLINYLDKINLARLIISDLHIPDLLEKAEKLKTIHKELGCELRDPNGTIWEYAAELKESNDFLSAKTLNTRDSEIKCSEPMAEAYLALCTELEQAKADRNRIGQQMRSEYLAEVAQVFAALPSTFYADRPLPERVQLMVSHWQKAVEMVNHDGAAPE